MQSNQFDFALHEVYSNSYCLRTPPSHNSGMSLRNTLWLNIAKFMARDGIATTTELARRTGIPQPTLHKFEKGTHRSISLDHIEKLARYFATDPARLFDTNLPDLSSARQLEALAVMEQLSAPYQDAYVAMGLALVKSDPAAAQPLDSKKNRREICKNSEDGVNERVAAGLYLAYSRDTGPSQRSRVPQQQTGRLSLPPSTGDTKKDQR